MRFLDRLTRLAPEGVAIDLELAGVASRLLAAVVDQIIQLVGILLILMLVGLMAGFASPVLGSDAGLVAIAAVIVIIFAILLGYHIAFEVLADGVTPGKRLLGLKVVRDSGERIDLASSVARNVLRIVDSIPGVYLVGVIVALSSTANQRLGDLVAGTVVVRRPPPVPFLPRAPAPDWDVTAVTPREMALIRQFLARRLELTPRARVDLAVRLATQLRAKVHGSAAAGSAEELIEGVLAAKEARAAHSGQALSSQGR